MWPKPKSSGIRTVVSFQNKDKTSSTQMKKQKSDSSLVQQLSLSVSAAAEDLAPQVEGGGGVGEHDEELFL